MSSVEGPDVLYAGLFEAVQSQRVFADSKTFVDAIPKSDVADILEAFNALRSRDAESLREFVAAHFILPESPDTAQVTDSIAPVRDRIDQLWDILSRPADRAGSTSSLIPLPRPYVVPGGRFREIYYWDSYFTMLGLAEAGHFAAIEDMLENFAYLIDLIGFVPNGNRSYFCSRSQPPFFVLMVELLAAVYNDTSVYQTYLPQLRSEYEFWMRGAQSLERGGSATRRVVKIGGAYVNRYWDDEATPRPESYAEDCQQAAGTARVPAELYRDIRAACESGWDFSSRWLDGSDASGSLRTTKILPVDLNSLLCRLEETLSRSYAAAGDKTQAAFFARRAGNRKRLLRTLFFDSKTGLFVDLAWPALTPTSAPSLATAFPLFLELAATDQASRVAATIQELFLAPGGWRTTLNESGQQWDRPNGWAPLQWIVYRGLRNYGFDNEAGLGASRWIDNNLDVYQHTGRLLEKYNVEQSGPLAGGGEYVLQDGFGWTNAVLLKLMHELHY